MGEEKQRKGYKDFQFSGREGDDKKKRDKTSFSGWQRKERKAGDGKF